MVEKWGSGFRAARKTPVVLSHCGAGSSCPEATRRRGQAEPLAANGPPNPPHAPLRASEHKEPGTSPDGEGAAETMRMGTRVQLYCREGCVGGERSQKLRLYPSGNFGRHASKRDPCSGAIDHPKAINQILR